MTEKVKTLLVSPHSDDICMSAAHSLRVNMFDRPIALCTVFSWSKHATGWGAKFCRPGSTPFHRIQEDERFCDMFDLVGYHLGFADEPKKPTNFDGIWCAVRELLLKLKPEVVVCPYVPHKAENTHVHHKAVSFIVTGLCGELDMQLVYVDDLPYSRRPIEDRFTMNGCVYKPVLLPMRLDQLLEKFAAMNVYHTQMRRWYYDAMMKVPADCPVWQFSETLWMPHRVEKKA